MDFEKTIPWESIAVEDLRIDIMGFIFLHPPVHNSSLAFIRRRDFSGF
jgi:hypothetical protein